MEEYSDEDDEVFVHHNIRRETENSEASKPLMKRKKRVRPLLAFITIWPFRRFWAFLFFFHLLAVLAFFGLWAFFGLF